MPGLRKDQTPRRFEPEEESLEKRRLSTGRVCTSQYPKRHLLINLNRLINPETIKQIHRSMTAGSPGLNPESSRAAAGRMGERVK
jgi:hypothetical protein